MSRLLVAAVCLVPRVSLGQDTDVPTVRPAPAASEAAVPSVPAVESNEPAGDATEIEGMEVAPVEPADQPCGPDCDSPAAPQLEPRSANAPDEGAYFGLWFGGYLRLEAGSLLPDRFLGIKMPASYKRESPPAVGRNDGFGLGGARLNVRGELGDVLYVRLAFDGAVVSYQDDSAVGDLTTGLKDAYASYSFAPLLEIFAGRFKPPFDIEELTPRENQLFVHRSLESRGVARHEGPSTDLFGIPNQGGFAPGRQLGIMVVGETDLGDNDEAGAMTVGYALAVTNGNSGNASLNDNDLPAVTLRVHGAIGGDDVQGDEEGPATYGVPAGLEVGLSGFYNEISTGLAPTRFKDRVMGAGLDVSYRLAVFVLQGQALVARMSPVTRKDAQSVASLGGHLQLAVQIPGLQLFPGYRFAYFDPRYVSDEEATAGADEDRVMHHTLGVRYSPGNLPLVFHLEYTRSVEQGGRATPNDRVEAAMQVTF